MKQLIHLTVAAAALALAGAALAPAAQAATAAGDPEAWHVERPAQPKTVLVQNATIWTCGPQGRIEGADMIVRAGKIDKVGRGLKAPKGAVVIDGQGKHVTPGIIDAHSHSFVVGGVNEGTDNVTAQVRIEDVINSETTHYYRQLAGGVTAANVLHGSANAIGGQNCVVKLRYGETPEGVKMKGAKPGIKFALGENPKQANWGGNNQTRYPQTRSGVEQLIRERFLAARDYEKEWKAWNKSNKKGIPPRRDLQLDTVVEILNGERLVHSHSYRADEILMLTRLADEFGFTMGTFQHVLEGYKVADEMAKHGAGASAFSDWWAYKFEVYDAIPYNGSIMWDRGVVTSFNSDSSELARHLNLEAAKAVKYGGVPEEEALKFVTLNPAIQLAIADRVGSLEAGKDADFVVWNGHPLSTMTRAQETWVDGRKYFDYDEDLEGREKLAAERAALIAKIKDEGKDKKDEGGEKPSVEGVAEGPGYQAPRYLEDRSAHGVCTCNLDHEGDH